MDTPPTPQRVAAVVALKSLPRAKSRLGALSAPVRERLARCMALDTLAALTRAVDEVLVVSDQPDLGAALARHGVTARVVAEPTLPQRACPKRQHGTAQSRPRPRRRHPGRSRVACGARLCRGSAGVAARLGGPGAERVRRLGSQLPARPRGPRDDDAGRSGNGTGSALRDRSRVRQRRLGRAPRTLRGRSAGSRRAGRCALGRRHRRGPAGGRTTRFGSGDRVHDRSRHRRTGALPARPGRRSRGSHLTVDATGEHQELAVGAYDGDPALLVPGRRLHAVRVAGALRCWS